MPFLLDTNILLAYIRFGLLGQYLEATYNLYGLQPAPFISIVTEGEIRAIALGKNDLWIAATAQVTGAAILTTDRDFDPLHGLFLQRDWIDPASRL